MIYVLTDSVCVVIALVLCLLSSLSQMGFFVITSKKNFTNPLFLKSQSTIEAKIIFDFDRRNRES